MKLWKISQTTNDDFETYDEAIVAAETEEDARRMHPGRGLYWSEREQIEGRSDWVPVKDVKVEYIGEAKPETIRQVIVASFKAG
jgi:hypothetical protein